MDTFSHVPPGFRFHPTDEELVDYYLRKKVASKKIDLDVIKDVDLYKIEPWDLQDKCKIGMEEQNDWYFFSHKDKKYPTGTRTNRATGVGFWKATGRDKPIYTNNCLVGMRKTLVFYKGRAPNGQKSDWIMHEYRLETNENGATPEEGWVVCRVFKKRVAMVRRMSDMASPCWFDNHGANGAFIPDLDSPRQLSYQQHHSQNMAAYHGQQEHQLHQCKPELEYHHVLPQEAFLQQLPQLESPKAPAYIGHGSSFLLASNSNLLVHGGAPRSTGQQPPMNQTLYMAAMDGDTDWRLLDKFPGSQMFTHGNTNPKEPASYSNPAVQVLQDGNKHDEALDFCRLQQRRGAFVEIASTHKHNSTEHPTRFIQPRSDLVYKYSRSYMS